MTNSITTSTFITTLLANGETDRALQRIDLLRAEIIAEMSAAGQVPSNSTIVHDSTPVA